MCPIDWLELYLLVADLDVYGVCAQHIVVLGAVDELLLCVVEVGGEEDLGADGAEDGRELG